jgi:uncharacterized protein (TIGR03067 family)
MARTPVDVGSLVSGLHGHWSIVYQEIDGEMLPSTYNADHILEIQGSDFKIEINGSLAYDGTFSIDATASPHQIVLDYKTSANPVFKNGPRPGVFQLEGNTLKWCFSVPGRQGPTTLNTVPGSDSVLTILHRGTAAAASPTPAARGTVIAW